LATGGPAGDDVSLRDTDANKADFERPTSLALAKRGNSLDCDGFSARHKEAEAEAKRHHAMMPILFRIKMPILLIVDYIQGCL
jgi:hypothetical protein